ncbi:MAG: AIR synthase family protein [Haloplanus sp.]
MAPALGKIDRAFFDEHVRPYLGADRSDVTLGPTPGVDFGLLDLDGTAVAVATDPVSVLPALGFARAGRFAPDVVLADVAVSGLSPSHLSISFSLPPATTDDQFADCWRGIHEEAADLGVGVVTGHTARYEECSFPWVGAATALAVGDPADVIRPNGARAGDDLLVTKGPAVETTGLLTTLFPDRIDLPADVLATAQARLDEARCVRDATAVAAAGRKGDGGVTAMHDATEGGLYGALVEAATSAGVRFEVERDRVPIRPGVRETCAALDVDPWTATSSGSLVVAVDPEATERILSALADRGTPAARVGSVRSGEGVYVDGERIEAPATDASWAAYSALST